MEKRSRMSTHTSESNTLVASLSVFAVLCGLLLFFGSAWNPSSLRGDPLGQCSQLQRANHSTIQHVERALDALNRNDFGEAEAHLRRAHDALALPHQFMGGRLADQQPRGR